MKKFIINYKQEENIATESEKHEYASYSFMVR
jgi:hypothetical protein